MLAERVEQDDAVFGVDPAAGVEVVIDEFGFEAGAAADAGMLFALEAAAVDFGDDDDVVGQFELFFAPAGPFFVDRLRGDVLIECDL